MTRPASPPPAGPQPHRDASNLLTDLFRDSLDSGYAAAARRRELSGRSVPTWRRRTGLGVRSIALALVGFLLAVAYQQVVAGAEGNNQTRADLAAEVAERRAEADRLAREAEGLRDDVSKRREEALAADPELLRLRDLEARNGLGRVQGNGVVVTVSDAPAAIDPVTGRVDPENLGRVLDRDLQTIANALWQCGAEAIAINGQRLTATSTIRAAGEAILVDFRPIARPYELAAIGPEGIDKRLADSATGRQFKRFVENYRMVFEIKARNGLTLPAGADPGLRYATPPPSAPPSGPASANPSPSGSRR
jgi:uncharacterized protein YlxW (UPF0749 family)